MVLHRSTRNMIPFCVLKLRQCHRFLFRNCALYMCNLCYFCWFHFSLWPRIQKVVPQTSSGSFVCGFLCITPRSRGEQEKLKRTLGGTCCSITFLIARGYEEFSVSRVLFHKSLSFSLFWGDSQNFPSVAVWVIDTRVSLLRVPHQFTKRVKFHANVGDVFAL